MLTRPQLLLLDEPSTGLDPVARIDLWRYLMDIQQNDGVTVLLTTHLMDEADKCSRLAIVDSGLIATSDTPEALKDRIGGDVITLSTPKPAELGTAIRDRFNLEAQHVDESDQTLRIERPHGHEFIPQLIEAFPGMIDSVSVGKPTLEDVFIHTTGHRFLDQQEPPPDAKKARPH
jgi:ABC-2 type transport system ATP-binding protein